MSIMFVQFSDAEETAVIAVFGGVQPTDFYPNQGEVADDDERYLSFVECTTAAPEVTDPVDKLREFLVANPDVAALLAK